MRKVDKVKIMNYNGPVKLMLRVKIAHSFLQKYVPLYHFNLAHVVQHMAVKEFFETHF